MNRLRATFCTSLSVLGLLVVVCCFRQAQAQGGWLSETEGTEEPFRIPLDWAAFGGVSCLLLGPLIYLAGRSPHHNRGA